MSDDNQVSLCKSKYRWAHAKSYSSYHSHVPPDSFEKALKWLSCQGRRLTDIHKVEHIIYLGAKSLFHNWTSSSSLTWKTCFETVFIQVTLTQSSLSQNIIIPCPEFYSFHNYTISYCFCISEYLYLQISPYQSGQWDKPLGIVTTGKMILSSVVQTSIATKVITTYL